MINPNKFFKVDILRKYSYDEDLNKYPQKNHQIIIYQQTQQNKIVPLYTLTRYEKHDIYFYIKIHDHNGLSESTELPMICFSSFNHLKETILEMIEAFKYGYIYENWGVYKPVTNLPYEYITYSQAKKLVRYGLREYDKLEKPMTRHGRKITDTKEYYNEIKRFGLNEIYSILRPYLAFKDFTILQTNYSYTKLKYCFIAANDSVHAKLYNFLKL